MNPNAAPNPKGVVPNPPGLISQRSGPKGLFKGLVAAARRKQDAAA